MAQKKAPSISVRREEAEPVRRFLRERNLLRNDLLLKRNGTCVYFPLQTITNDLGSYPIVTQTFEERKTKPASYKELVHIPLMLRNKLPSSYDVIGDIILLKLPKMLRRYQKVIGTALLEAHPNIRTVCKIEPVSGELRIRKIAVIAGEKKTRTIQTEYRLSFHVDVKKTYFSPRLSSERYRIANLVQPGETVVDMFAGVAPFSIMIAHYAKPKIVYAIDKNREAVALAKENVRLNNVLGTVEVLHADAKEISGVLPRKADRIIMNLPFSAHLFFSSALSCANRQCIVHYYDIIKENEIRTRVEFLAQVADEHDFHLSDLSVRKMKSYAPREFYIGIDITATKHADVA